MKLDYKYFIITVLVCILICTVCIIWALSYKNTYLSLQSTLVKTAVPETASEKLISNMKMTFDDEFDTFSQYLDTNGNSVCGQNNIATGTWQTMYYNCTHTTASNNEAEWYISSSTSVSDGILTIEASTSTPSASEPLPYTSGIITTEYSFSQMYGYFEMRAELPAGTGLWPAFWLLPVDTSWPPEIDVMEAFGDTNPVNGEGGHTMIHYASHTPPNNQICGAWYDTKVDVTAGYHTYGVDWEPNSITYYFDGTPYATCPGNPASNKPFYMIANLAVGAIGSWPGEPNTTTFPAYMRIDYIRAYQKQ